MTSEQATASDLLVQFSRRSLWLALTLILALAAYAVLVLLFPDSTAARLAGRMAVLLPIVIAIAVGALRSSLKGVSTDVRSQGMKALLNDELRQHALSRAYRNGLLAVLLVQPVLGVLLSMVALPNPLVLMACASVLLGVAVVLCSLLAYDR